MIGWNYRGLAAMRHEVIIKLWSEDDSTEVKTEIDFGKLYDDNAASNRIARAFFEHVIANGENVRDLHFLDENDVEVPPVHEQPGSVQ